MYQLHQQIKSSNASIIYADLKGGEYDFGVRADTYAAIKQITARRPFTLRVPLTNKETRQDSFDWLCEHALEVASRNQGKVIFVVDEAQRVTNKNQNAYGLELIQEDGGRYGLDLWTTTHRPSDIHGSLRAAADRVVVFQTHHTADIKVFQENIDVPDAAFKALRKGNYLEWDIENGYRVCTFDVAAMKITEVGKWRTPSDDQE